MLEPFPFPFLSPPNRISIYPLFLYQSSNNRHTTQDPILYPPENILVFDNFQVLDFRLEHLVRVLAWLEHTSCGGGAGVHLGHLLGHLICGCDSGKGGRGVEMLVGVVYGRRIEISWGLSENGGMGSRVKARTMLGRHTIVISEDEYKN